MAVPHTHTCQIMSTWSMPALWHPHLHMASGTKPPAKGTAPSYSTALCERGPVGQEQVRQGGNHRATYRYYKLSFPSFHFTNVAMIRKGPAQHRNKKEGKGQNLNAGLPSPSNFSAEAQGCPIKILPPLLQI